jgi:hypothetical protein
MARAIVDNSVAHIEHGTENAWTICDPRVTNWSNSSLDYLLLDLLYTIFGFRGCSWQVPGQHGVTNPNLLCTKNMDPGLGSMDEIGADRWRGLLLDDRVKSHGGTIPEEGATDTEYWQVS